MEAADHLTLPSNSWYSHLLENSGESNFRQEKTSEESREYLQKQFAEATSQVYSQWGSRLHPTLDYLTTPDGEQKTYMNLGGQVQNASGHPVCSNPFSTAGSWCRSTETSQGYEHLFPFHQPHAYHGSRVEKYRQYNTLDNHSSGGMPQGISAAYPSGSTMYCSEDSYTNSNPHHWMVQHCPMYPSQGQRFAQPYLPYNSTQMHQNQGTFQSNSKHQNCVSSVQSAESIQQPPSGRILQTSAATKNIPMNSLDKHEFMNCQREEHTRHDKERDLTQVYNRLSDSRRVKIRERLMSIFDKLPETKSELEQTDDTKAPRSKRRVTKNPKLPNKGRNCARKRQKKEETKIDTDKEEDDHQNKRIRFQHTENCHVLESSNSSKATEYVKTSCEELSEQISDHVANISDVLRNIDPTDDIEERMLNSSYARMRKASGEMRGYNLWSSKYRSIVEEEYPDSCESEVNTKLAEIWEKLPKEHKLKYCNIAGWDNSKSNKKQKPTAAVKKNASNSGGKKEISNDSSGRPEEENKKACSANCDGERSTIIRPVPVYVQSSAQKEQLSNSEDSDTSPISIQTESIPNSIRETMSFNGQRSQISVPPSKAKSKKKRTKKVTNKPKHYNNEVEEEEVEEEEHGELSQRSQRLRYAENQAELSFSTGDLQIDTDTLDVSELDSFLSGNDSFFNAQDFGLINLDDNVCTNELGIQANVEIKGAKSVPAKKKKLANKKNKIDVRRMVKRQSLPGFENMFSSPIKDLRRSESSSIDNRETSEAVMNNTLQLELELDNEDACKMDTRDVLDRGSGKDLAILADAGHPTEISRPQISENISNRNSNNLDPNHVTHEINIPEQCFGSGPVTSCSMPENHEQHVIGQNEGIVNT